jgi:hypothetical protein
MVDVWYQYNGRGSIFVLDNYHPYRKEVVIYLDLIATTYSGRTLFKYCNRWSGRRIEIRPFVPTPTNPVNAATDFRWPDSFERGQPVRESDTSIIYRAAPPAGAGSAVRQPVLGTGNGSDATVRYHPANPRQFVANMHAVLPGSGPGEMLFHELVHAMRAVHGVMLRTAVPENSGMRNFDEFCAVTAANVYRSERGFKLMRGSESAYKGDKILSDPEL